MSDLRIICPNCNTELLLRYPKAKPKCHKCGHEFEEPTTRPPIPYRRIASLFGLVLAMWPTVLVYKVSASAQVTPAIASDSTFIANAILSVCGSYLLLTPSKLKGVGKVLVAFLFGTNFFLVNFVVGYLVGSYYSWPFAQ